jgi:hypothetical protein
MARMHKTEVRKQIMGFLATYDVADAGRYERHVVRVARTWLSMLDARQSVQGLVNRLADEFSVEPPPDYGCGWADLKAKFTAWAIAEQWLNPDGTPPRKASRRRG